MNRHQPQERQEIVWLLIALLTPLFVNFWVEQQFEASKVWLLRTLVWILVVLWLKSWITGVQCKPLPAPTRNLLIALALIFLLATFFSTNHYIAIFGTLDRANGVLTQLSYLLLFACVATQINRQQGERLLHIIVLTAAPICLFGIAQATGWQPFPIWTDARSAATTTLGRANFTGAYLSLLFPLTLTAARMAPKMWWRRGYVLLAILELTVIALSQARAAWVAVVVGTCILLWLWRALRWSNRVRWISGLSGFVVVGSGLWMLLQRGIADGGSIAARWTIWQASLRLLRPQVWLGYGADTLELHFPSVYPPQLVYYQGRGVVVDRAHNWLLDWSLNFGVVAVILFIALIYLVLRAGWQHLSAAEPALEPERAREKQWVAASMATVCTQLVGNLFLFDVAATAVVFWLMLAIITASTTPHDPRAPSPSLSLWARRIVMMMSTVIVGWAIWQANIRPLLADAHSWHGTQALAQGNRATALAEYAKSAQYQPQRAPYHVAVALTATQSGNFARAQRAMNRAIALRPTDPVLYAQLAAIYVQTDRSPTQVELASRAYEQAISIAPTIGLFYQQYADLALRAGDLALASALAQQAVELDATDGVSFGILGWLYLRDANLPAALHAFEQAVKWQPDSADFHLGLATVHFEQGNLDAARRAVRQSLRLDPTLPPALTLQVQLQ